MIGARCHWGNREAKAGRTRDERTGDPSAVKLALKHPTLDIPPVFWPDPATSNSL
jgi:hypothetical protein